MAKVVWTFTFIVVGMMLLLAMAGVDTNSSGVMKSVIGADVEETQDMQGGLFWGAVWAAIALLSAASVVVIGIFGRQTISDIAAAGLATAAFGFFLSDMFQLINIANSYASWAGMGIKLLILPLCFGYVAAMFDWVRGRD
jgi:small-conductance mechanosensitive channel|tara:strand:- start:489 stop:908 length:420 start_codon:yes stop_codon:yes gene_type:complete